MSRKSQDQSAVSDKLFFDTSLMPKVGVSACLLGKTVRFDGGHKNNEFISNVLTECLTLVTVCPEVEAGFSTPRPAMQLRREGAQTRLVISKDSTQDMTGKMRCYTDRKIPLLSKLDGFIFKKDSPSCGVFRVPVVINQDGRRSKTSRGLFAQAFIEKYPLIPVEEEGRLHDVGLRENFFERVYAYSRWKMIENSGNNVAAFIDFHARHKLLLMARGSTYYQELGRMVAGVTVSDLTQRREAYIKRFMQVMAMIPSPGRQVNVLQHILGYLKQALSSEDKKELLSVFEAYRQKKLPLITPILLLQHYLRIHPQAYIGRQHYLRPFPEQLALRSFI